MRVEELWKTGSREWDIGKLEQVLTPEDVELAKSIRLSRFANRDVVIWPYTSNTEYTVKSGYWVATHVVEDDEKIEPPPGTLELKNAIWKVHIPPKIQHFLWKAVTGAIPTAERLCSKTIAIDPVCQRCCLHEETINHVLFHCQHANSIWRCAGFTQFDDGQLHLEDNIRQMFQIKEMQSFMDEKRLLPFWIVWMIWKSRNEFIFTQRNVHPQEDTNKGVQAVAEWILANPETLSQENRPRVPSTSLWEPPESGWLKCNFASTFRVNAEYMGVGWIIRDDEGHYIESGWAKLSQVSSSLQAEANGFLYVTQRIWSKGMRQVWFEGDCLELVNVINKREESTDLGNLLIDIRHWISLLPLCSLEHVNREKNQVANRLSKCVYDSVDSFMMYVSPPQWLTNYLYYPFTI